jgi:hypothetical protein
MARAATDMWAQIQKNRESAGSQVSIALILLQRRFLKLRKPPKCRTRPRCHKKAECTVAVAHAADMSALRKKNHEFAEESRSLNIALGPAAALILQYLETAEVPRRAAIPYKGRLHCGTGTQLICWPSERKFDSIRRQG